MNRWICPQCKGENIEIALPVWFTETTNAGLIQTSVDTEADVLWWYCPNCDASDNGNPQENPKLFIG